MPVGVAAAEYSERVDLVWGLVGGAGGAVVLGVTTLVLAARGNERIQRTLGRSGGRRAARAGRAVAVVGLCLALTAALALGFWGLLELFADT